MAIRINGVIVGADEPTNKGCIIHVFVDDKQKMIDINAALMGKKLKGGPLEPKFSRIVQNKPVILEFD